ncbi:MAG: hypothetical protein CVU32_03875, partial [Betaproteobacteria bacterium HGW-Betaproteobacteria-5]
MATSLLVALALLVSTAYFQHPFIQAYQGAGFNSESLTADISGMDSVDSLSWNGSYWLIGGGASSAKKLIKYDGGSTYTDLTADISGMDSVDSLAWNDFYWLIGGGASSAKKLIKYDGGSTYIDLTANISGMDSVDSLTWNGAYWLIGGGGSETLYKLTETEMPGINFSGYEWFARTESGVSGPGPNFWDRSGVWLDFDGNLCLKIHKGADGNWYCSSVNTSVDTLQRFGFGRYQWQITGSPEAEDPEVVFGMFNYPPADFGEDRDGTNEIDIELAKWGFNFFPFGHYTVYPPEHIPPYVNESYSFNINSGHADATHRFVWDRKFITFQSLYGHTDDDSNEIVKKVLPSQDSHRNSTYVPQKPLPVFTNLWLHKGNAPASNSDIVVKVKSFKFYPGPLITSMSHASAAVDDVVTISGDHFGSAGKATFNGKEAKDYSKRTDQEIKVKVPSGATSGNVEVSTENGTSNSKNLTIVPRPQV